MHEGHRQRLRQTYIQNGLNGLHEHQVLELLLTYAISRRDTNPLAHNLLERFGTLENVLDANPYELMQVEGIGESAAVLLSLTGNLHSWMELDKKQGDRLANPESAMRYCIALLSKSRYECMFCISLNKLLKVQFCEQVSSGTLSQTTVYPRLVVESALRHSAYSVILTHNHPSGDLKPSSADIETTGDVLRALESVGIKLHDHIITSDTNAYSMLCDKLLEPGEADNVIRLAAEKKE